MHRFLALSFAIACSGSPRSAADVRAGDLVFTDVTVVPMDRDGVLAHRTVVVRGDRIAAIASAGELAAPPGATVVDGRGKWLMPGLADMHVHTWSPEDLTMFVAAGVTTVRNMFGSELQLAWRNQIASGQLFGPTIVTASPIIDGDPPVWPGSIVLTKPADADRVVAEVKAQGYDFLKPYSRLTREAYEALAAAGAKHGLPLDGHVPRTVGLAGAFAAKQRTIEHLDGWLVALLPPDLKLPEGGEFWAGFRDALPKIDESRLPALVRQAIAAGTWNCPTLIVLDRMSHLDDVPGLRARAKWLDKVPAATLAMWDPANDFRIKSRTADDFATMRAANAVRARVLAALAAGGAPIIAGTDTGNPYVIPGEALHDELELMIAAGVPRALALRSATANAAELLGKRGELGVVAPGARADLLLVGSDPLAGPLPLVPDGVVLRGAWLPKAQLEAKLAALVAPPAAPAGDRWKDVPALPVEGAPVHRAHYDIASGGKVIGEERLAVTVANGARTIVSQAVLDVPLPLKISYTLAPGATSVVVKSSFGEVAISAKLAGTTLEATTTDRAGKPQTLTRPMPAGTFLAGPGIGGSINLAGSLATMKPGERRAATSLELSTYPQPAIEATTYDITREPDANGARVYTVRATGSAGTITGPLVVDASGYVVSQTFGPPLDFTFTRR
jgi:hypothetical protein